MDNNTKSFIHNVNIPISGLSYKSQSLLFDVNSSPVYVISYSIIRLKCVCNLKSGKVTLKFISDGFDCIFDGKDGVDYDSVYHLLDECLGDRRDLFINELIKIQPSTHWEKYYAHMPLRIATSGNELSMIVDYNTKIRFINGVSDEAYKIELLSYLHKQSDGTLLQKLKEALQ